VGDQAEPPGQSSAAAETIVSTDDRRRPLKLDFTLPKNAGHLLPPHDLSTADMRHPEQHMMLSPAISLLSITFWLGYLIISARAAPVLQAIAQRAPRHS
jgi:hypothetical protein